MGYGEQATIIWINQLARDYISDDVIRLHLILGGTCGHNRHTMPAAKRP
jgi:hypothetical protein